MSQDVINLKVLTPLKLLVEEDVSEISLPGLDGYLGVLPGHRPLLVVLGRGNISFLSRGREEKFPVQGGYADIKPGKVLIFTELGEENNDGTVDR